MKTRALKRLRAKLAADEPVYGMWVTLETATVTEMAVAMGLDWVVIDTEHGHLDWRDVNEHIRAANRSDTVVVVRIAERSTVQAKRALDIGADGLVIPQITSVSDVEESIRDALYPPNGRRGIGAERATAWGQAIVEHVAEANEHVLIIPMIENIAVVPHVPAICNLEGIDLLLFGPNDFSSSAGHCGQWEGPGVAEEILRLKDVIRTAGKHCAVVSTSVKDLLARRDQGVRMLGIGSDCGLILRSLHDVLAAVDRDCRLSASLDANDGRAIRVSLNEIPEGFSTDRDELMTRPEDGEGIELQSGVHLVTLVGECNGARNLMTGIVYMQPKSVLDCHTHPVSESITVLEGQVEVTVEGRAYVLGVLDNITIPRWLPHGACNTGSEGPARLHVALAMSAPERDLVARKFCRVEMPADSSGESGFERVTRFESARRDASVGPGADFIDYFNAKLVPGIEMSGGFGRFQPGGRLPAHLHDFDESISIVSGSAKCLVEDRQHTLVDCATALVPRGRVHYFINESSAPMDMIWVYAGPMPERILVDKVFATPRLL